jgi:hypothetical protein
MYSRKPKWVSQMKKLPLAGVAALFLATGTVHATDELKPDELFQKLYQECKELGIPGPIAACLFEKEEAFGKELEQGLQQGTRTSRDKQYFASRKPKKLA